VIACHGLAGGILLGSDNKIVPLKTLQTLVNHDLTCAFRGFPKIFLISACRGEQEFEFDGHNASNLSNGETDFYTAYSTVEGYVSCRDPDAGTMFLQAVADVWQNKFKLWTVERLMTHVRVELLKKVHQQVVETSSTLTETVINGVYRKIDDNPI